MLFPKKMLKVNLLMHSSILEEVVDTISTHGIMQLVPVEENLSSETKSLLVNKKTPERVGELLDREIRLERLKDISLTHFPDNTSMLEDMMGGGTPREIVHPMTYDALIRKSDSLLKKVESRFIEAQNVLTRIDEDLVNLKQRREMMYLLSPLNIPVESLGKGKYTFTRVGTTPDLDEFENALRSISHVTFEAAPTGIPETPFVVMVLGTLENEERVQVAMRGKIFNELKINEMEGDPGELMSEIDINIGNRQDEKENILEKLEVLKTKWAKRVDIVLELLRIQREKYEVQSSFGKTDETVVVTGWIEKSNRNRLKQHLGRYRDISVEYREPDPKNDQVPSQLSRSRLIKPFQGLVTTFSPPKYNDLNPTPFVAVLFVLFFGIMLGDAGYGLIILTFSFFVGSKVKEGFMADMAFIGKWVGTITTITGVITGSFFGDMVPRLFYGDPLKPIYTIPGVDFLPYDSLRNPLPLFMVGLGLGLITIYLSVVLSAVTHIKQAEMKTFLFTDLSLLVFIPGFIVLVINLLGMGDVSFLLPFAYAGVAIGFLLLIGANLSMPLLALFEVTGFLGDLLSFARILALGLATVGLAMTWNIIAEMFLPLDSIVGGAIKLLLILVILVFFHLFNFVFQTLGACIHSLRLQYIEFFNRCYTGGGILFTPFAPRREYTEMKKK